MRKVVQIAVTKDGDLYALCDDGSIWVRFVGTWRQVDLEGIR